MGHRAHISEDLTGQFPAIHLIGERIDSLLSRRAKTNSCSVTRVARFTPLDRFLQSLLTFFVIDGVLSYLHRNRMPAIGVRSS
jgi:hypothetical protein